MDHITISDRQPYQNKPNIGVSFYPSGGDNIRVYDYYLPHVITNTQYRGNRPNPCQTLPNILYDKGQAKSIKADESGNYTYSVTLPEPNFKLGFAVITTEGSTSKQYVGTTWNKNSAPWAAANVPVNVNGERRYYEGHFVLKDDPSLLTSLHSSDYNYYKYNVTITNNDSFPAKYYIEDNGTSVAESPSLNAGEGYMTSISIPREQNYSSSRNIRHTISVYSREGGKEQAASTTKDIPNVPRNTMTYRSYYGKGTITVRRTSHFGSSVNETLSSGSYI